MTTTLAEANRRPAAPAGAVRLLADDARPGVLTAILEPGVTLEVLELQRLGDKCVVQLRYKMAPAGGAGPVPRSSPASLAA